MASRRLSRVVSGVGAPALLALAVLGVGFACVWGASAWFEQRLIIEQRARMESTLAPFGNSLALTLQRRLLLLEALEDLVRSNRDSDLSSKEFAEKFEAYASGLFVGVKGVRALQFVPVSGPMIVFPLSGNEQSAGITFDALRNDERPEVREDVAKTLRSREPVISGPYELRQGGMGIVARQALYDDDDLLGLAVVVLDLRPVLQVASLDPAPEDVRFAVRDEHGRIFAGDSEVFDGNPVLYPIRLADATWDLAMVPSGGWASTYRTELITFRVAGVSLVLLASVLSFLVASRGAKLRRLAHERASGLVASEDRFRRLVEGAPDAIFVQTGGRFAYVNPAAVRLYGARSASDLIGTPVLERVAPSYREIAGERIQALNEDRQQQPPIDQQHLRLDGSVVEVAVSGVPMRFEGEDGALVFVRDVSARKAAEAESLKAHERLRRFVDSDVVGVVVATADGRVIEANDYYLRLIGRSREEFEKGLIDWREITPAEWLSADERAIAELRARGVCTPYEKQYERPDGSRVWVYLADALLPGEEEQIAAFAIDITERKNAEEALRHSEQLLRSTMDTMLEGCQILDHDMRYVYINDAAEAHNRRPKAELLGGVFTELWPGIEQTEVFECVRAAMADGSPQHVVTEFTFPDGERAWFEVTVQPIPDGVLILTSDVTERVRAEAEIVALNRDLELKIQQRTADLELANQELETFSYSVSHDLRAPLRHIGGYVDLLVSRYSDSLDDRAKHYLEVIAGSVTHMNQLIEDLLELSRTGRHELALQQVDMSEVVAEALAQLADLTVGRSIEFDIGELPTVRGDRSMLRLVLVNLLGNAIKYTRDRDPAHVEVGAEDASDEVVFYVRDNGVGFDMRYADKLFGVFQRLHTDAEFEGTGIGLANVRRVVARHGGRTWAEAEPDRGATVYFTIPKGR